LNPAKLKFKEQQVGATFTFAISIVRIIGFCVSLYQLVLSLLSISQAMPPKTKKSTPNNAPVHAEALGLRRSTRVRAPPTEVYRPSKGSVPQEFSALIREVAINQAKQSKITIESTAMGALEDALEQVLERLFTIASGNATKHGRANIEEADLVAAKKQMNFRRVAAEQE
jgi:histone H3/H4